MNAPLKMLQYNVRGIVSKDTKNYKCPKLNALLQSKQIDVVLLQEWCATVREDITTDTDPDQTVQFPLQFFPNYHAHYHSAECAILYHKDLCVTPLNDTQERQQCHSKTLQKCGIIIHSDTKDYEIYSVYRTRLANPNDIFKLNNISDYTIISGDFNIHHSLWGSKHYSTLSNDFVGLLSHSKYQLLNTPSPTRIDPRNET